MKETLIGVLLLAFAGFATVLVGQSRPSIMFSSSTEKVAVQFDRGKLAADGTTSVQNLTLTIGDVVITADAATLEPTGIKLGANARVSLPTK